MLPRLIPVIDLSGGRPVLARAGPRSQYRALRTPLCRSTEADAVAVALCRRAGATELYLADLDAIMGRGDNLAAIQRIHAALPTVTLWVDAGIRCRADLSRQQSWRLGVPVLGSESLREPELLSSRGRAILSLDFDRGGFRGDPAILSRSDRWPAEVIVMLLSRIGGPAGPDWSCISMVRERRPDVSLYAAGGVRSGQDLARLERLGVAGALVATALHGGQLP